MKTKILLSLAFVLMLISLSAQNSTPSIQLSYQYETAGKYLDALEMMQNLETSDPNDAFYKLRIAWLYYNLGKYNEAISYYQKSQKLIPSLDAKEGQVNCYLAQGKWNDALATANEILQDNPGNFVVIIKAGYALYQKQEYRQALEYYQRVLKINAFNFEARGYVICCYYYMNDRVEAKKHWLTLKKYSPTSIFVTDFEKIFN